MHQLISLARNTIEKKVLPTEFSPTLKEKKGVFVTLTLHDELRGCVGTIMPVKPLYKAVIDNANAAAYHDLRFAPLTKEELKEVKIEIAILTVPTPLTYKDEKDLIAQLNHELGVVIEKDGHTATYLPEVWGKISKKIEFLEQLSLKAGLDKDAWKSAKILVYKVKKILE